MHLTGDCERGLRFSWKKCASSRCIRLGRWINSATRCVRFCPAVCFNFNAHNIQASRDLIAAIKIAVPRTVMLCLLRTNQHQRASGAKHNRRLHATARCRWWMRRPPLRCVVTFTLSARACCLLTHLLQVGCGEEPAHRRWPRRGAFADAGKAYCEASASEM
jgi:hypothetical protein